MCMCVCASHQLKLAQHFALVRSIAPFCAGALRVYILLYIHNSHDAWVVIRIFYRINLKTDEDRTECTSHHKHKAQPSPSKLSININIQNAWHNTLKVLFVVQFSVPKLTFKHLFQLNLSHSSTFNYSDYSAGGGDNGGHHLFAIECNIEERTQNISSFTFYHHHLHSIFHIFTIQSSVY